MGPPTPPIDESMRPARTVNSTWERGATESPSSPPAATVRPPDPTPVSATQSPTPSATPTSAPVSSPTPSPEPVAILTLVISEIPSGVPEYDRDYWRRWRDEDGDCQDTRQEVLLQESRIYVGFRSDRACRVATDAWLVPYGSMVIMDPGDLDIDHMVPLANAHRSGGWRWPRERKRAYAILLEDPQTSSPLPPAPTGGRVHGDPMTGGLRMPATGASTRWTGSQSSNAGSSRRRRPSSRRWANW